MTPQTLLRIGQITIAAILIGLILLQQRGGGLSGLFGGMGGEFYGTRRGLEKGVFVLTIVFAALFVMSALAGLVIR
jgi:protein translocase SecG subunit